MSKKNSFKRFWNYLWNGTTWDSYLVFLIVIFVFIKFFLFPSVGFILNNDYPIVAIVSGSMEHKIVDSKICNNHTPDIEKENLDFNSWWNYCGNYYEQYFNLNKSQFNSFKFNSGLNIGDVMILYGKSPENIKLGEVLVFIPQDKRFFIEKGPVIHRVVKIWQDENGKYHFQTKGDHNSQSFNNFENDITEDNVIGIGMIRIPLIGYAKIAMNNVIHGFFSIITSIF
ncbi:MAG: signal peptidase I [Nanoarchaeota archaeon]|nr:signal peptidase I [Nanoarchaeota archaeon]